VVRAWARILQQVPHSRLVVDSRNYVDAAICGELRARFAAHGIDPDRLELGFHTPPWSVLREADIALDCFPHNSGTTLFESLWMGLPFVTLAGRPSVGRLGSSILHGLGRSEWIAEDEDGYVERAVALASDLTALAALRAGLREQMRASGLMDEPAFARKVERAYREMFARWATGAAR
jgi:predicted O-linked N-acetylglucosamine transferase (SPINDLY family)